MATTTTATTTAMTDNTESQVIHLEQLREQSDGESPNKVTVEAVPRWNQPRGNLYRTLAAFWAFLMMGMNDAAYGPLIPYQRSQLQTYYSVSYTIVSLVFLSPFAGYILAALLNTPIHLRAGQRGISIIAPSCKLLAYIVIAVHPPFPVLVVIFLFAGFGIGLEDAAWNAYFGVMEHANELLGVMHSLYGLGAVISPLIATSLITRAKVGWWYFYYIMIIKIGLETIELITSTIAFFPSTAATYRAASAKLTTTTSENGHTTTTATTSSNAFAPFKEALFKRPHARVTWLATCFLLLYMGTEVALGGWIVEFALRVRHADQFPAGMTATGFWLGVTVGRLILGFVTPRIGVWRAIAIYLPLAMGCNLLLWLVPSFIVSAVAVSFMGFFLGPLFPGAVLAATRLLPKHLHITGIGFAAAFGGGGAALFPFAIGAIAQAAGVKVLQPVALGMLAGCWLLWMGLPRRWDGKRD
ncbi:MAG: hypothetical protein M1828_004672 [Chrysothrix sp. TS-e1954]|nr:MAG: hypothetical protein M1828_004672 [Chrysothrix sp. TS-e1954]